MTVMTVMPRDHNDWTVKDLEDLPDDGLQYELFDGVLLVSPAPRPVHQRVLFALSRLLYDACPAELEVFFAPLDFQPTDRRSAQPDALVIRRDDVGPERITGTPLLVVEVLSKSTRSKDRIIKQEIYRGAGVPSYWIFDPGDLDTERQDPRLEIYELRDEHYVQTAVVTGDQKFAAQRPFDVTVCPANVAKG